MDFPREESSGTFRPLPNPKLSAFAYDANPGSAAREELHALRQEWLVLRKDNAFEIPIIMSNEDIARVNQAIAPLTALPSEKAYESKNFSMHPVLFAQSFIADYYLDKLSKDSIGSNMFKEARSKRAAHPSCMLMDGREDQRVKKAILGTKDYVARMNNYLSGGCCVDGAQNCHAPTEVLVCNSVLFHVDEENLFKIFKNKNVQQMYASLPIPDAVKLGISAEDHLNGVRVRVCGDITTMSFIDDDSLPYLHRTSTWQRYATANVLDGHLYGFNFNLVFERFKRIGITYLISITRTEKAVTLYSEVQTSHETVSIYNFVNDMPAIAKLISKPWFVTENSRLEKLKKLFEQMPKFQVPRSLLTEVENFLFDRRDSEIDRQHAGGMLTAKIHQIVIGHYELQKGLTISAEDFTDLVIVLLVRAFINRQKATKSISFAARNIVRGFYHVTFKEWVKSFIPSWNGKEAARLTDFAKEVMEDTALNESVRRLIFDADNSPLEVIMETASAHQQNTFEVPTRRPYTYNPIGNGECYHMCVRKMGGVTELPIAPSETEVKRDIEKRNYPDVFRMLDVGTAGEKHCTLEMSTYDFCRHGKSMRSYKPQRQGKQQEVAETFDRCYLAGDGKDNAQKTKAVIEHFKGETHNLCAMPFNDASVWAEFPHKVTHHAIPEDYGRRIIPQMGDKHEYVFLTNATCAECTYDLSGNIYADFGTDVPKEYLASNQTEVLRNLRDTEAFQTGMVVVKLQDRKHTMEKNYQALEAELQHWAVVKHHTLAANEALAVNENFEIAVEPWTPNGFYYLQPIIEEPYGAADNPEHTKYNRNNTIPTPPPQPTKPTTTEPVRDHEPVTQEVKREAWKRMREVHNLVKIGEEDCDVDTLLRRKRERRAKTPSDGHCLLHAFAQANGLKYKQVFDDVSRFYEQYHFLVSEVTTFKQYMKDAKKYLKDKQWNNAFCEALLTVLGAYYQKSIMLYAQSGSKTIIYKSAGTDTVRITLVNGHYTSIENMPVNPSHVVTPPDVEDLGSDMEEDELPKKQAEEEDVQGPQEPTNTEKEKPAEPETEQPKQQRKEKEENLDYEFVTGDPPDQFFREEGISGRACSDTLYEKAPEWLLHQPKPESNGRVNTGVFRPNYQQSVYLNGRKFLSIQDAVVNTSFNGRNYCCKRHAIWSLALAIDDAVRRHQAYYMYITGKTAVMVEEYDILGNDFAKIASTLFTRAFTWLNENADYLSGEIGNSGKRLDPDSPKPCGDYFEAADIPRFEENGTIPFLAGKNIANPQPRCPCVADLPFHGVVLGIENNRIVGPTYKVPDVTFTQARFCAQNLQKTKELSRELEREKQEEYKKLHKECAHVIQETLKGVTSVDRDIYIMEGTYCSGKTRRMINFIKKNHPIPTSVKKPTDFIVITPNAALAEEYKAQGVPAYSWSKGLSAALKRKDVGKYDIYLDEYYLFDYRVLPVYALLANKLYAIGDSQQMRAPVSGGDPGDFVIGDIPRFSVAYNTPLDVVMFTNDYELKKTTTLSRVVVSVKHFNTRTVRELPPPCAKNCDKEHKCPKFAVFDRNHANTSGYPTVASIQGLRTPNMHLFVTPAAKNLCTVRGQRLVALTRHTKELNMHYAVSSLRNSFKFPVDFCGCSPIASRKWYDFDRTTARDDFDTVHGPTDIGAYRVETYDEKLPGGTIKSNATPAPNLPSEKPRLKAENDVLFRVPIAYTINEATHSVTIPDYDGHKEEHEEEESVEETDEGSKGLAHACDTIEPSKVLSTRMATTSSMVDPNHFISVHKHRDIAPGKKLNIKNIAALSFDTKTITVSQMAKTFGARQMNVPNHVLATAIERYSAIKRKPIMGKEAEIEANKLIGGFRKFVVFDELRPPTTDELALTKGQALLRAAAKADNTELEVYGDTSASTSKIKCFNKQQLKSKFGDYPELNFKVIDDEPHIKGGQMVSAQPKEVNAIVSPWIGWAERIVFSLMKPGVFPGYGHSPAKLRAKVCKRLRKAAYLNASAETVSCDISEQDTTKSEATDLFMREIYQMCGVPNHIIDIIEKPNVYWEMNARHVKTKVKYQFQSGRADTLFSNTMHTMGLIGMSFKFDELALALFQGDDCMLRAAGLKVTEDVHKSLKIEVNPVGSFVGFLYTNTDMYLDIPRLAAKTLTKTFADNSRREELRLAVKDLIDLHRSFRGVEENKYAVAAKYKATGMTIGDAEILYNYLVDFASRTTNFQPSQIRAWKEKAVAITEKVGVTYNYVEPTDKR